MVNITCTFKPKLAKIVPEKLSIIAFGKTTIFNVIYTLHFSLKIISYLKIAT